MTERAQRAALPTTCRLRFAVLGILFLPPLHLYSLLFSALSKAEFLNLVFSVFCVWYFRKQSFCREMHSVYVPECSYLMFSVWATRALSLIPLYFVHVIDGILKCK